MYQSLESNVKGHIQKGLVTKAREVSRTWIKVGLRQAAHGCRALAMRPKTAVRPILAVQIFGSLFWPQVQCGLPVNQGR